MKQAAKWSVDKEKQQREMKNSKGSEDMEVIFTCNSPLTRQIMAFSSVAWNVVFLFGKIQTFYVEETAGGNWFYDHIKLSM